MDIGKQIKKARKAKRLTQKQLAEQIGVATGTVQQYELNKRQPRIEQLQKIADLLGVSPTFLIGFDEQIGKPELFSPEELAEIKAGAWDAYRQYVEESVFSLDRLNDAFILLNAKGQEKAVVYVEDLTKVGDYRKIKKSRPSATNTETAAHMITRRLTKAPLCPSIVHQKGQLVQQ